MIDFNFTKVGTPVFTCAGLAPTVTLDGSSEYLSLDVSAGNYDITGALTLGAWVNTVVGSTGQTIMGRWDTAKQAYWLAINAINEVAFTVSGSGSDAFAVAATDVLVAETFWHFVCARYIPSTEIALWVNADKYTNVTSIPASLYATDAAFRIGHDPLNGYYFNGSMSLAFICAEALSDRMVELLYNQSKALFDQTTLIVT